MGGGLEGDDGGNDWVASIAFKIPPSSSTTSVLLHPPARSPDVSWKMTNNQFHQNKGEKKTPQFQGNGPGLIHFRQPNL